MKVLIVDDQEINRLSLVGLLEGENYTCLQASSGPEALQLVRENADICMILMDVVMPGMCGIEATRQIRHYLGSNHIPIIFVTSSLESEQLENCFSAGGDDFISRPITPTLVLSRLSAHLRLYSQHASLKENNKALLRHQQEVEREHAVVEHVFNNVIMPAMTDCDSITAHLSPLSMFNGDLYLVHRSPDGHVYVFLGDFTGHGLSAAIGCMPVADLFYAMSAKNVPVAEIAAEANKKLIKILPDNMFCCSVIMRFDPTMEQLDIWVGGMNDIFLLRPDQSSAEIIPSAHMPLGILGVEEFDKTTGTYTLETGSRIFAYTDGVIEYQNPQGEMFGEERLRAVAEANSGPLIQSVLAELETFKQGCEQRDDITLIEIDTAKIPHCKWG